jgi:hypothetical protein
MGRSNQPDWAGSDLVMPCCAERVQLGMVRNDGLPNHHFFEFR